MKMCPNCGKITNEDICPVCGTPVNEVGGQKKEASPVSNAGQVIDASPVNDTGRKIDASPVSNSGIRINAAPINGAQPDTTGKNAGRDVWAGGFKMSRKLIGIIGAVAAVLILVIAVSAGGNKESSDDYVYEAPEFEDSEIEMDLPEIPEVEKFEAEEFDSSSGDGYFTGLNLGSGTNVDPDNIINEKEAGTIRTFYELCAEKGLDGNVMEVPYEGETVYVIVMDGVENVIAYTPDNFGADNAACVLTKSIDLSDAEKDLYMDLCAAMFYAYGPEDFSEKSLASLYFDSMRSKALANRTESGEYYAYWKSPDSDNLYFVNISPEGIEQTFAAYD